MITTQLILTSQVSLLLLMNCILNGLVHNQIMGKVLITLDNIEININNDKL